MITIEQAKWDLDKINKSLAEVREAMGYDALVQKADELKAEQARDGFWEDMDNAQKVNRELSKIESKLKHYDKLFAQGEDLQVLIELTEGVAGEDEMQEVVDELGSFSQNVEALRLETLLKGKYDGNNAILTLHAGAGGTEAQDWASMLYRMYTRYAERVGYKVIEVDKLAGDEAGIKSVTFKVVGENAYGYLKSEKGVHRLVRISPFDSNARRHTSFASLEVMPEIENKDEIKINSEDLKIDTYRSGGAGGQHVNKTESAIRITHLPTGIVVQCQNERSQIQNREQAMGMLISKLIERQEREMQEKELELKGEIKKIEWGSQIRSYVFCPYTMVKDHRTGCETGNISAVMDGDIEQFIFDYLKKAN
ncbi:MAG: peptide chain release factor 2 [Clostridia bacterium]|nr:peptide chain release factor 2 [Clostridia bacterium]